MGAKAFIYHGEGGKLCQFSEGAFFFFFKLMSSMGKKHVICVTLIKKNKTQRFIHRRM